MGFNEAGWKLENGVIEFPDRVQSNTAFNFIHEAIYDGHLPITKVIGFHITTSTVSKQTSTRVLERDKNCADDRFTIASNLSKLLVINDKVPRVYTDEINGTAMVSSTRFTYSKKEVRVLSSSDYLLTALQGVSLDMVLYTGTGYQDTSVNYERLLETRKLTSRTRYLPMFSYHNLLDFIRVLPGYGNEIRLVYRHGMTDEILLDYLNKMFDMKPDREWCDKYKEVFG